MNKITQLLKTKHIEMRELVENDMSSVYEMYQNKSLLHLWSPNTEFDSFGQFKDMLVRRLLHRWDHGFVFIEKQKNSVIGFAYCYNANEFNKNTCVCLYIDEPFIAHTYALQASFLYLNKLFLYYKYRKIYAEVYSYNRRCVRLLNHIGFTEEGCLKDHQMWNGKYWDQYIFSMTKEIFDLKCTSYNELIERVI